MLSYKIISNAEDAKKYYYEMDNGSPAITEWFGKGAENLGYSGSVEKEDFYNVLKGNLPNGVQLYKKEDGSHRAGMDLTFSLPKSVSIQSLIGGDKRLDTISWAAVRETLTYIENTQLETRKTVNGTTFKEQVKNCTAAIYNHTSSRALDPQQHFHVVLANVCRRDDGEWRSLTTDSFFEEGKKLQIGHMFRSILAKKVRSLGYEIDLTGDSNFFEIRGIGNDIIKNFSKRSEDIKSKAEEMLKQGYVVDGKMKERITLYSRNSKKAVSNEELDRLWKTEAKGLSFDSAALIDKSKDISAIGDNTIVKVISNISDSNKNRLDKTASTAYKVITGKDINSSANYLRLKSDLQKSRTNIDIDNVFKIASSHLLEMTSTFKYQDLVQEVGNILVGDRDDIEIMYLLNEKVSNKEFLFTKNKSDLYKMHLTTKEALQLEKDTIGSMNAGKGQCHYVYTKNELLNKLQDTTLNQGQKDAVNVVLNCKDRISGIQGSAGVGKTYVMQEVNRLSKNKDIELIGLAPSLVATENLEDGSGIKSRTVSSFINQYLGVLEERATSQGLLQMKKSFSNKIVVVDESSMLSTKSMHSLNRLSEILAFRIRYLGDTRQLEAVEAGRPFYQLQKAGMQTAKISAIVRQDNELIRETAYLMAEGVDVKGMNFKEAINKLSNSITEVAVPNTEMRSLRLAEAVVDKWRELSDKERANTLIISPSHQVKDLVMRGIRTQMKKEGVLDYTKEIDLLKLERDNNMLTQSRLKQTKNYKVGHIIELNQDIKKFDLKRDNRYEVIKVDQQYNLVKVKDQEGQIKTFRPEDLTDKLVKLVSVYNQDNISVTTSDIMRWTKSCNDQELKNSIHNGANFSIKVIGSKYITIEDSKGSLIKLNKNNPQLNHIDFSYSTTVHSAQGLTSSRVISVLESNHTHLTTQRMAYVSITRAKNEIDIITDDKEKLAETLALNTGSKTTAMDHQNISYDSVVVQNSIHHTQRQLANNIEL